MLADTKKEMGSTDRDDGEVKINRVCSDHAEYGYLSEICLFVGSLWGLLPLLFPW